MQIVHKRSRLPDRIDLERGIPFVVSTAELDAHGDTVDQSKWDLRRFKSNPVVLFNHKHDQVVGRAEGTQVKDGQLVTRIYLADEGTSAVVDMVRALVAQKIIRSVSAGFIPTTLPEVKRDKQSKYAGLHFVGQQLLEISICAVPANPATLAEYEKFDARVTRLCADPAVSCAIETRERRMVLLRLGSRG